MSFLQQVPVVFRVTAVLALILVLNAWGRHLVASLILGTLALALWCGHGPVAMLGIAFRRTFSLDHTLLILITLQVICLGTQMSRSGVMRDLVSNLRRRMSQRSAMGILPAVIGLLPMPGGAIFSAPLIDDCDRARTVNALLKTRINYWFRHVWEYWWPLYPGVLLLLSVTGLDVWQLAVINIPLTLGAIGAGYLFMLRDLPDEHPDTEERVPKQNRQLLALMAPILSVIGIYALVRALMPVSDGPLRYIPMVAGVATGILMLQTQRPLGARDWRAILLSRRNWHLVLLVTLVRVYGAFIEAPLPNGDLLVETMNAEFTAWGVPIWAVAALIPFACGIATGLAVGMVGASFPIVLSLLGPDPTLIELLPTVVLAYGWGYVGMMLSPVHVCLIVSNEHFRTRLYHSLGGLLRPAAAMLLLNTLYTGALVWILRGVTSRG